MNRESPSMKRRTVLAGVGAAVVAGCSTSESDESDDPGETNTSSTGDDSTSDNNDSTTETDVIDPPITVESASIEPTDVFELAVTPAEPATSRYPATFSVELRNVSSQSQTLMARPGSPLPSLRGERRHGDATLHLLAPEYAWQEVPDDDEREQLWPTNRDQLLVPPEPDDGCWRVRYPPDEPFAASLKTVEPGDSLVEPYTLLADSEREPCLQPGEYAFGDHGRVDGERVDFEIVLAIGDGEA